ncbi:hypothetical protein FPZ49_20190 [Paenibacillus cremeus]|uniref:Uncharacterized protein n=1 Tax=Paenibacillus cremeus TaxID=2163881 RepID=A0A559K813_9BACL|nr:hypothetical protein FPZ49_20190 [Paenibacillus cremeus]
MDDKIDKKRIPKRPSLIKEHTEDYGERLKSCPEQRPPEDIEGDAKAFYFPFVVKVNKQITGYLQKKYSAWKKG